MQQRTPPCTSTVRAAHGALAGLACIAYALFASGVPSFTLASYLTVLGPVALVLAAIASMSWRRSRRLPSASLELETTGAAGAAGGTEARAMRWPLLAIVAAGIAVEIVGLGAGGRSAIVPTLSTIFDRILQTRLARAAAFALWLALGLGLCRLRSVAARLWALRPW